jgi:CCR4-NOT transcriptional complex subunit CAF120
MYLLHFNSVHALNQWTASIRLAIFEHSTLQEAYTGSLIAGKGKLLNNIGEILTPSTRFKTEEWVRVRFGTGTPWRRCWCVISPPDEKVLAKHKKTLKKSAYSSNRPHPKGNVKFYEKSRVTKKSVPIATITEAYSAYAIYPQSKPLIDQSTLCKIDGLVTMTKDNTAERTVFVMPEVHAGVGGFEMLLRFLFPLYDTFALYGRPTRLIADTLDQRGLMFAMPKERQYGYLETMDVISLISTDGSDGWSEAEWRRKLKDLTAKRIQHIADSRGSRRLKRNSYASVSYSNLNGLNNTREEPRGPLKSSLTFGLMEEERRTERDHSAPPAHEPFDQTPASPHKRSVSDVHALNALNNNRGPQRRNDEAPPPPMHLAGPQDPFKSNNTSTSNISEANGRSSSDSDPNVTFNQEPPKLLSPQVAPVSVPPTFSHAPGSKPAHPPRPSADLRRANSRMSTDTLGHLAAASGLMGSSSLAAAGAAAAWKTTGNDRAKNGNGIYRHEDGLGDNGVFTASRKSWTNADTISREGQTLATSNAPHSTSHPLPLPPSSSHSEDSFRTPFSTPPTSSHGPAMETAGQQLAYPALQQQQLNKSPTPPFFESSPSRGGVNAPLQPPKIRTNSTIARKPLPQHNNSLKHPDSAEGSSIGSIRKHGFDEAAFDQIRSNDDIAESPEGNPSLHYSAGSDYNESSTADYASTRRSTDTRKSVERPRAGVMKTVGDEEQARPMPIGDMQYHPNGVSKMTTSSDIPAFDFGPTMNLASGPSSRPGTGGRLTPQGHQKQKSTGNFSYERPQGSPRAEGNLAGSPRQGDERSLAWAPGMAMSAGARPNSKQGLSPEQFIQQQAQRVTPVYAHGRSKSRDNLRSSTPPIAPRQTSGTGPDVPVRPSSRNSSYLLNTQPQSSADITQHLSAREQQQVARMTGTPLINMAQNTHQRQPSFGLVGAIEQREREKKDMKSNLNSHMVQQAVQQRQQMVQPPPFAQQASYNQQSMGTSVMGRASPSPSYNNQQYQYNHPMQQQMAQQPQQNLAQRPYGAPATRGPVQGPSNWTPAQLQQFQQQQFQHQQNTQQFQRQQQQQQQQWSNQQYGRQG